ncbi:hypothetical protein LCGC14_2366350, partial [marine sediment metagenome]
MKKYFFTKEEIFKKHKTECHRSYYGNDDVDRENEFVRYIEIKTTRDNIWNQSTYKRIGNTDYFKEIKCIL